MNPEAETLSDCTTPAATPSVDFIQAISQFFDTDPDDLLMELGYYKRSEAELSGLPRD